MTAYPFNDESTLAEATDNLGKKALKLGLIPSFFVHYFPDNSQYYIPNETSDPLTPEEAYFRFKKLLEQAG